MLCPGGYAWHFANPWYNTYSGRGQASSTHNVFSKDDIKDAVSFLSSAMASKAQGPVFCSELLFFRWNKSSRARMELVQNVEADQEGGKGRKPFVLEVQTGLGLTQEAPKGKIPIYAVGICFTRLCRKGRFIFGRKDLTWSSLPEILRYTASGQTQSQQPGWGNVMANISLLPREKVLYRDYPTSRAGKRGMCRLEQNSVS